MNSYTQLPKVDGPVPVRIEASIDAVLEYDLSAAEGEQYDVIFDVISIEHDGDDVLFTTCRTIQRMDRPVFRIPRHFIESITFIGERA